MIFPIITKENPNDLDGILKYIDRLHLKRKITNITFSENRKKKDKEK